MGIDAGPCTLNTAAAAPALVLQQGDEMGTPQLEQVPQEEQEESPPDSSLAQALQALSRKELLDMVTNETADESRHYNSFTKGKLIEKICTILGQGGSAGGAATPMVATGRKRGRKPKNAVAAAADPSGTCKNTACRAPLTVGASFCKRCSCCICRCYDDNKDPSLWMVCGDDPAASGACCGLSCHLECAVKEQLAGVVGELDGSFLCPSCGNITSLVGIWKKNLVHAKTARRVDVLHQRLTFARQLFEGTKAHSIVQDYVEQAAKLLLRDMGPQPSRSIVNRLACGAQVQGLIGKALDTLESGKAETEAQELLCEISFEEVTPSTVILAVINNSAGHNIIGYKIFHRRNRGGGTYKSYPTAVIRMTDKARIADLHPSSAYTFKAVAFSAAGDEGYCEAKCQTKRDESNSKNENKSKDDEAATSAASREGTRSKNDSASSCLKNWKAASAKSFSSLSLNNNEEEITSEQKGFPVKKLKLSPVTKVEKEERSCEVFWDVMIVEESKLELQQEPEKQLIKEQEGEQQQDQGLQEEELGCAEDVLQGGAQCPVNVPSAAEVHGQPQQQQQHEEREANMGAAGGTEEMVVVEQQQQQQQLLLLLKSSSEDDQSLGEVVPAPAADDAVTTARESQDEIKTEGDDGKHDNSRMDASSSRNNNKSGEAAAVAASATAAAAAAPVEEATRMPRLSDGSFMECVRMVRWLECEGHLTSDFRKRFFTWFGLRASEREKRVVSVYIETMNDDPAGLAGQLVDAFEVAIASNRRTLDLLNHV